MVVAERVAGGSPRKFNKRLPPNSSKGNAKQVVQAHLIKKGVSKNPVEEALQQFVLGLDRGFNALDDKIDQIASVRSVASLKRGESLIRRLLQKVEGARRGQVGKKQRGGGQASSVIEFTWKRSFMTNELWAQKIQQDRMMDETQANSITDDGSEQSAEQVDVIRHKCER